MASSVFDALLCFDAGNPILTLVRGHDVAFVVLENWLDDHIWVYAPACPTGSLHTFEPFESYKYIIRSVVVHAPAVRESSSCVITDAQAQTLAAACNGAAPDPNGSRATIEKKLEAIGIAVLPLSAEEIVHATSIT